MPAEGQDEIDEAYLCKGGGAAFAARTIQS